MPKYLSFTVDALTLGVDMTSVISIDQGGVVVVDGGEGLNVGTVTSGGKVVPLYNLSRLFGGGARRQPLSGETKRLMVRTGTGVMALWVDAVGGVTEVQDSALSVLPPVFAGMARDAFPQVVKGGGGWIPLISPDALERVVFEYWMNIAASSPGLPEAVAPSEADPLPMGTEVAEAVPWGEPEEPAAGVAVEAVAEDMETDLFAMEPLLMDAGVAEVDLWGVGADPVAEVDAAVMDEPPETAAASDGEPAEEALCGSDGVALPEEPPVMSPEGFGTEPMAEPEVLEAAPEPMDPEALLADRVGKAITPGMMERIIGAMMRDIVSELTAEGQGL